MKKLTKLLNGLPGRYDEAGIDAFPEGDMPIPKKLDESLAAAARIFGTSRDMITRRFMFGQTKRRAAVLAIDGLCSAERIAADIIKPLLYDSHTGALPSLLPRSMEDIRSVYLNAAETHTAESFAALTKACLAGDAVLLIDGIPSALTISAKGFPKRSVEDPQTESVLRGPREGFIESIRTNTALLRRRIRDPHLTVESVTLGRKTNTDIAIVYLRNVADPSLVEEVRRRLKTIDTDAILDSGTVEQYISDRGSPFFSTVASSEKPDATAGKLLEGRVAILIDGSPYVLTVPTFFIETFHTAEDYYIIPVFATALRLVRFTAFIISILALPLYVALTTFHQELIPTELLLTMAEAEGNTPFPAVIEAFIMIIVFEILKEAGIRLPRPAGQAVSMVGAIIIGETSVSAGIIGAPMVIAVAITAVSAFAAPAQANASMILRLLLLLLAGTFGGFGLSVGLMLLLFHLASLRSFGVPYLAPVAPFRTADQKDAFLRAPLSVLLTRPRDMAHRNPRRQTAPEERGRAL